MWAGYLAELPCRRKSLILAGERPKCHPRWRSRPVLQGVIKRNTRDICCTLMVTPIGGRLGPKPDRGPARQKGSTHKDQTDRAQARQGTDQSSWSTTSTEKT